MAQDIRNTEVARKIESYFDAIAQGNKGDATTEMLEQDGSIIRYRVQIRHYHVWDSWAGRVTMYDITTPVQGEFDLKNPATFVDQQACVDVGLGIGRVCVSLRELAEAILAAGLVAA